MFIIFIIIIIIIIIIMPTKQVSLAFWMDYKSSVT